MALGQMGAFMKRVDGDGKRHGGMGEGDGSLWGLAIGLVRIYNRNRASAILLAGLGDSPGSNLQQEQGLVKKTTGASAILLAGLGDSPGSNI